MKVFHISHPYKEVVSDCQPHVMALGFFDGVHLGHQTLLNQAGQIAKQQKIAFSVMTISPHPDEVIKGDMDRKYLTLLDEKLKKLESIGVDQVFVVKFDREFASLSAVDFVRQYIINFNVIHVVVGFDFTFGFKPGIYHVSVTDGKDTVNAIFQRFDRKERASEISFLTHRGRVKSKEFRVKFVNRISFNEALSV